MGRATQAVTVTTTPTRLDVHADLDFIDGQVCTYYNAGAVDVWAGDVNVTVGNGIKLAAGGVATESLPMNVHTYGVVASGTCQVNVDQVGV